MTDYMIPNATLSFDCSQQFPCMGVTTPLYGDNDIGHAMAICQQHLRSNVAVMNPPPRIPEFAQGWEACQKVYAAWLDSEEARQQHEREAEIERQRQFINEVAGKLK